MKKMKIIKKITNWLHSDSELKWNTLHKDQDLHLLIFENDKYTYQISKVISIKEYESICNVRFKYTENGKRIRVNLAINKLKYNLPYLAVKRNTEWARDYTPIYGDMIITFNDPNTLNDIYKELITAKIKNQEEIIIKEKDILNKLNTIQYDKIYE